MTFRSILLVGGLVVGSFQTLWAENLLLPTPSISLRDTTKKAPENWFNLDGTTDKTRGVSTEKAYQTILKNRTAKPIIVAVIDSGVDIAHEDLKDNLWINAKEIPNNGIDDDKNGYIDDIYGWNFIGGKDGKNVSNDTYEMTRLYVSLKKKYEGKGESGLSAEQQAEQKQYLKIKDAFEKKTTQIRQQLAGYKNFQTSFMKAKKLISAYLDTDDITIDDLKEIDSSDERIRSAAGALGYALENNITEEKLNEGIKYFEGQIQYGYNTDFDPRTIVGDNYEDLTEKGYGNNDVAGKGADAKHGTHVAGIIAANRSNGLGMMGVANNVKIMSLRAVPDGDERDKDIANAIRYAVDNGAKIINMSFGKSYSPHKKTVDEAMQYAESKGVLLIHAAGNDGKNLDEEENYPNKTTKSGVVVGSWVEVGASSWGDEKNFVGDFSNYGKKSVDLFAPGVDIYSTIPEQKYENNSGTSMAAPVTSGVAATILSYFPDLSAAQLKEVLMKSVVRYPKTKVNKPGATEEDKEPMIEFEKLSVSGGLVNLYEAAKLAEVMSKKIKKK